MSERRWWNFARSAALALVLAVVSAPAARAATELQFSASVDRTTVGLGEQFQLILSVQGENMLSVPAPVLAPLPDFENHGSSSSQSTSITIINGQMKKTATISYVYALAPRKMGTLTIGPCRLTYNGQEYRTQPIEIAVVKGAQAQAPAPTQSGFPTRQVDVPVDGNLFLSVDPSRKSVYLGEPVMVDIALYTRFQITNGGWATMPSFDGFWAEKVFDADKFDFQRKAIGGKVFAVSLLKKTALFPLSAGDAKIKPMAFNVTVTQPPRDFFDVFGSAQSVKLESKPVTIKVLPLPETGKPAEFTGGVGQFTVSASLEPTSVTNGEPVNLTIRVGGRGNVRLIGKPQLPALQGLRILDPEIKDDVRVNGDEVRGTRTFRFPIMPQSDGKYVIAPIPLAYFDPQAKTYKTLQTGAFEFSASGSAPSGAPVSEATGLKVLGTDINYIKPDAASLTVTPFGTPRWPNLLYLLSLGTVGTAFWYRGHSQRLLSDRGYARKSRSSALVKRRLRQAEKHLKKRDDKAFYTALDQAVLGYIGDRFNIETQAMTKDQVRAELDRLAVPPDTTAAVIDVIEQCEIARFSPGLLADRDPATLFQRARDTLGRI